MSSYHSPVLLRQSTEALVRNADGIYADCTFGGGGHSRAILDLLSPAGRLVAFDKDSDALANGVEDARFKLIHNNFRFIYNYSLLETAGGFDGILADLGVSSHQFDTAARGFSFRFSAPLDMRMNVQGEKSAADIVNSYTQEELENLFKRYGELDNARRLAQLLVLARSKGPVRTTDDLNNALADALPPFAPHKQLARIYQALRIGVNGEMRDLEKFLEGAARALKPGGRLCVITYHSLEDRMVKNFIRSGSVRGDVRQDAFGRNTAPLQAVNRKPAMPDEREIGTNTRARSAKLRIAQKREDAYE
ncbi:MAG: 16S rRNA (cytosine(1402)-N(4))-methyltransferase RsmH [Bacteroidales bacterium]|nr:16S rRNA (cytosine(1402)-N(4))-methyltransferase RsmH [Bacteroidales bacterium]